jgi:hypothetical protein
VELLEVTGRRLVAEAADDLWLKSADGIAAWMTAGSVALHWSSFDRACCSVESDEAGELIWLVPNKVFAPIAGGYGSQNVPREHAKCTARDVPVSRSWTSVMHVSPSSCSDGKSLTCFSADCQGNRS